MKIELERELKELSEELQGWGDDDDVLEEILSSKNGSGEGLFGLAIIRGPGLAVKGDATGTAKREEEEPERIGGVRLQLYSHPSKRSSLVCSCRGRVPQS